jgi:NAD(P)-dependent dehydrogenase (short-subunit alcohol dehydrogenase family)
VVAPIGYPLAGTGAGIHLNREKYKMEGFKDRVAVIVGATDASGMAIGLELADYGAAVILCNMDQNKVEWMVEKINEKKIEKDRPAVGLAVNTADSISVRKAVKKITKEFGKIDILVNYLDTPGGEEISCVSDECWAGAINSNLNAAFFFCREIIPEMRRNKYGRVINVSGVDYLGWTGKVDSAASKAAAFGMTRALALEAAKDNVMVNCIAKGDICEPDMLPDAVEKTAARLPVKKIGQPEDVAKAVSFFASQESKYITGQMFFVCGGKSLYSSMSV